MATTVQTLPLTRGPSKNFRNPFPASPLSSRCRMGSVGSLVERPDVSPTKVSRAVPQVRPKHSNGLLKKGFTQRELLNYLNITRWVQLSRGSRCEQQLTYCYDLTESLHSQTEKSLKQTQAVTPRRTSPPLPAAGSRTTCTPRSTIKTAPKLI